MTKILGPVVMIALGASMLLAHDPEKRGRHWGHGVSISVSNPDSDRCEDHIEIRDDDNPAVVYGEESRTVPNTPLRVTAARNGGIHVRQWEKNEIGVKVCKAAAGDNEAEAKQRLAAIKMEVATGEIRVDDSGARDEGIGWPYAALIFLQVPKGATLNLSAHNGGIALDKVDANVTARTVNGGIKLQQTAGKMDIEATNGGVKVKDCSGDVNVEVQNGGVHLELAQTWNGKGLTANTHNGGLKVSVPANFQSSLEVESRGYGRMSCRGAICSKAERGWDDERPKYLRLGGPNPVVKASTVNGGVVVSERGADYED